MNMFDFKESIQILERTPESLKSMLSGLSDGWLEANEGEGTWNPREVVDHLAMSEETNWIPRVQTILRQEGGVFPPFDRFAHLQKPNRSIDESLEEFRRLREVSLKVLKSSVDPAIHLDLEGQHPVFGTVTLSQLLATWTVHDLTHITQIVRVLARRYTVAVGPWSEYLSILRNPKASS